ncbi:MAG: TRAP transporter substrate-binding protein [Alcaligenaceae bacterium]|nr:TRAP transporter substrate-binding protein [Alcaligenaceae bacterium]
MKLKTLFSCCLTTAALAFLSTNTFAQVTLKLAHFAEIGHPANQAALQFSKRVEERTNGQVKVSVYPANALGSPPEQLQQVKLGVLDMGLPTQGALDKYNKAFAVVMLPFVFDDLAHAHRVLDGPAMDWLAPIAEKDGFVMLANWEYGFRNLTNSKLPINAPGDLKGLKIRVPPEMQLEAAMEALGANVTKIAFPELYMALSQGVVDGEENPIAVIMHNKFYEVQKHLALTRHAYNSMVHVISTKTWAKLTPEQRIIVKEESRLAGELMRKTIAGEEDAQVAKLQSLGMLVTRPDLKLFRVAMAPAYKRIATYAGEANVQQFMLMVDAQRSK